MGQAQCLALPVRQGVQHCAVQVVRAVQLQVVGIAGAVEVLCLDQDFANRCILAADAVQQFSGKVFFAHFQADVGRPAGHRLNGLQCKPLAVGAGHRVQKQTFISTVGPRLQHVPSGLFLKAWGEGVVVEQLLQFFQIGMPDQLLGRPYCEPGKRILQ